VSILNPAESKITSINALTDYDFDPIESTNSSNPVIVYNPDYEDVSELDITILTTQDNSIPSQVQIGIYGCPQTPSVRTKAAIEESTTAATSGTISVSGSSATPQGTIPSAASPPGTAPTGASSSGTTPSGASPVITTPSAGSPPVTTPSGYSPAGTSSPGAPLASTTPSESTPTSTSFHPDAFRGRDVFT
jgi:hypothetical protein